MRNGIDIDIYFYHMYMYIYSDLPHYIIFVNTSIASCRRAELKAMAGRIHTMREQLFQLLKEKDISWPHVMKQIGMFSYTGLTRMTPPIYSHYLLPSLYHIHLDRPIYPYMYYPFTNLFFPIYIIAKQVDLLKTKHHIYMTTDGRISLPGLNSKNVQILANAVQDVLHNANL